MWHIYHNLINLSLDISNPFPAFGTEWSKEALLKTIPLSPQKYWIYFNLFDKEWEKKKKQ